MHCRNTQTKLWNKADSTKLLTIDARRELKCIVSNQPTIHTTRQPTQFDLSSVYIQSPATHLLDCCYPCSTICVILITNHQPLFSICITSRGTSLLHSINLVLFTLLVHLISHISPQQSLCSLLPSITPLSFHSRLTTNLLDCSTNPFIHSLSGSIWTYFRCLTRSGLTGSWRCLL